MIDKRLIGTWKSNLDRTMREIKARRDMANVKRSKLKKLFGKLRIKYGRKYLYTDFDGSKEKHKYKVVAKDDESVVIEGPHELDPSENKLYHIHYEDEFYWICLGKFREYFKKVL